MAPTAANETRQPLTPQQEDEVKSKTHERPEDAQVQDEEHDDEEYHDSSSEHQPIDPAKHPITPAINKRRQASKLHMIQSPTDNIFSPISKKLLGRKRTDVVKELPEM